MNLLQRLLSLLIFINYNERNLIKNTTFNVFVTFFFFLIGFFAQITLFYWNRLFKFSKTFKELIFFNSFFPFFFQYIFYFNIFFDLFWFCYLYFTVTALIFFSFPYFLYSLFQNRFNIECSEVKYKFCLFLLLFFCNDLRNSVKISLIVFFCEILKMLKLLRLVWFNNFIILSI